MRSRIRHFGLRFPRSSSVYDLRNSLYSGICKSDLRGTHSVRAAQQADQYLLHYQRREQFRISRMCEELNQPCRRVEDFRVCPIEVDCASIRDTGQTVWKYLQNELGDNMGIQIEAKRQEWLGSTGAHDA